VVSAAISSGRGYALNAFGYIAAYALPAAIVWGAIAIIVHPLTRVSMLMLLAGGIYALVFGSLEVLAIPFRQLSSTWQVPAQWLQGRSALAQSLIWGVALGPGLATRNPYAGMWLLPVLLMVNSNLWIDMGIGVLIGLTHGGARALEVLKMRRNVPACGLEFTLLTQWRWRVADGLLLLVGAGCFAAFLLPILSHLA
jgi:hypothetical protein